MLDPLRDGRVEENGALRGDNNGRFGSDGVCFRNGGSNSISSTRKLTKTLKEKGILEENYKEE